MKKKYIYLIVILIFIFAVALSAAHKWAESHVTYITGGVPHPPNCISCHVYPERDGLLANLLNEDYLTPLEATTDKAGQRLFVTANDADALIILNTDTGEQLARVKVGRKPHSVVVGRDEKYAYVSNQWSNNISIIDLQTYTLVDTIMTGGGPAGMEISKDGHYLYVANTYANNISVIDLLQKKEVRRLHGGNHPTAVAVSPTSDIVYVASQRTMPIGNRDQPRTEVTVLSDQHHKVTGRKYFFNAHIMENVAFSPDGDLAIFTLIRPKNLVPSVQIENGWMINHGIGIIYKDSLMVQLLLDEPNQFYADPYDVVITPDGHYAYVSSSGADVVSVLDLDKAKALMLRATRQERAQFANNLGISDAIAVARIHTGANPRGLQMSPDGKRVYVVEYMEDRVSVIDTKSNSIVRRYDLGGPHRVTVTRQGGRLFRNAGHTYHNQYSCYTCHPDGNEDGLTYDLTGTGRNIINVQTLRDLEGTAPYKWNGKNVSIYMQCGMRFSKFVTRSEAFSPDQLDALVAYIKRELRHPPNLYASANGQLTAAQQRGKAIFERTVTNDGRAIPVTDRCTTCHSGPNYSNFKKADVGTLKDTDSPTEFDAPNLLNVYETPPYLHDGSAATLEEIWTKFNPDDKHGYANDMTKNQLNDLVEYLKSLSSEQYAAQHAKENINKSQF